MAVAPPQYVVPLLAAPPLPQPFPAGDQMLGHQCNTTAQFIIAQQAVGMLATHLYHAEKNKARMHSQQLELNHLRSENATLKGAAQGKKKNDTRNRKRWENGTVGQYGTEEDCGFIPKTCSEGDDLYKICIAFLNATKHKGRQQRKDLLREFYYSVWDGNLALDLADELQQFFKLQTRDIVKYQARRPRAFNDTTFGEIRTMMGLEEKAACFVPCKSSISKWRCMMVNGLRLLLRISEMGIVSSGDYFEFFDPKFLLTELCRRYNAHKYVDDDLPLTFFVSLDGAPTTNNCGFIALCLRLGDPRLDAGIMETPQSPDWCFPVAGLWASETSANVTRAFSSLLKKFRELGGLFQYTLKTGEQVWAKVKFLNTPDKKAEWAGYINHGGGLGGSTAWAMPKNAVSRLTRAAGAPGGCGWHLCPLCSKNSVDGVYFSHYCEIWPMNVDKDRIKKIKKDTFDRPQPCV